MSTTTRSIPPLLTPYLSLPSESSLILLTGVLGAGTNWLLLRYLSAIFSSTGQKNGGGDGMSDGEGETKVVFLSFMRDMGFWREGARKINLDLDKLTQQSRFLFLDGLSSLHLPQTQPPSPSAGSEIPLKSPLLPSISLLLNKSITTLSSTPGKTILILDSPDFLIASTPSPETITQELNSLLLSLRSLPAIHSTILTLSIDTPLLSPHPQSPLATNTSAFTTTLAHEADLILSTRLLDTGAARDVSGVLRITAGANPSEGMEGVEEKELLYFVGGDGSVRVFERGQ
ncbi:uncharacterized protein EAF01_000470 [Botrytis porri]|uniref:Elongator complex protein 6 n=1 Tax=Botrytis porri TaxID=87229 RepID=A0A4Z1K4J6_9HELO|nr:uncharacterized protein EAF01_000470 [Botrytis porri]KAF7914064.1 hypothetical protein EAF01_000470 [Botrytis porri]TGO81051.1 hypothetical protein BPOR_1389g00020 [Botrytis porri]